jgi:hypothetical protein
MSNVKGLFFHLSNVDTFPCSLASLNTIINNSRKIIAKSADI